MQNKRLPTHLFALLLVASVGLATSAAAAQPAPRARTEKKYVAYKITRGDFVTISIVGEPELMAGRKRVEATGTVNLLYINEIRLVGLTIAEAQEAIAAKYREERFLRNPQVSVTVDEYVGRNVIVGGKVNAPGRQEIPPDAEVTIMDVISKAGGLGDTARGTAIKVTRTLPDGSLRTFTLDVESALKGRARPDSGDPAFVVEPDDIIYVPEKII